MGRITELKNIIEADYSKQRQEIDGMIAKLSDSDKKMYKEKLAKADGKDGGAHRAMVTGIHAMLRKATGMHGG